jgi:hypothetical protein
VFEGIDCHVQRAATELGISSLACLIWGDFGGGDVCCLAKF